jgi:radical SAM superfamily enzyme YgiQ (UPF0313 family)
MVLTPVYCIHPAKIWAPTALAMLVANIEKALPAHYRVIYPFAHNIESLQEQYREHGPGILLCSNYMWTREANLEIGKIAKAEMPGHILIHGGPDTPAYPDSCEVYLKAHREVDFTIRGEGESTLVALLEALSQSPSPPEVETLKAVEGICFLSEEALVQTPDRARAKDINIYPSPFLEGVFEQLNWQEWNAITLETNRGCPYGCSFCDWGSATMQKMRRFEMDRLKQEILWVAQRKIPKLWIADSNFGIFKRDLDITRYICEVKKEYGYPKLLITNYAKNTKAHLIEIIEMLVDNGLVGTGIVSLQTRDQATLDAVRRHNIKTREYDLLRETFEKRKLPMSTQLMIGLPGSTRESFKADLRFFFNQNIDVQIFRTVVLPNSPMAHPDYLAQHELRFDETGMLRATAHLSEPELDHMEQLARLFRCAHTYGMFRYWLSTLQWEYAIDPIDYLDRLAAAARTSEAPWIAALYDQESPPHDILTSFASLREQLRANGQWLDFYATLGQWTQANYPQVQTEVLELLAQLQSAVMPNAHQQYPRVINLSHDFERYYLSRQANNSSPKSLLSYPIGNVYIKDPLNVSHESLSLHLQNRSRPTVIWELESTLAPEGTEGAFYIRQKLAELAAEESAEDAKETLKKPAA